MFSKEEAAALRREFWTGLGHYLSPVLSSEGLKVNWLNYKTGVKNVYFRPDADRKNASIAIEITHEDAGIRELYFEQFLELRTILQLNQGEEWIWELNYRDQFGKEISRIHTEISGVSIYNRDTWPNIISFIKPRIIALDEFWNDVKLVFDSLK